MSVRSFIWAIDLNGDGSYSPLELWEAAKWLFRLPGNLLIEGMGNIPFVSPVLHIRASEAAGYTSLNGGLSSSLSLLVWAAILVGILCWASPSDEDNNTASKRPLLGTNMTTTRQLPGPGTSSDTAESHHAHLPVSRSSYAMPGLKPVRHKRHRRLIIT